MIQFPKWRDVIVALFQTEEAKSSGLTASGLKSYIKQFSILGAKYGFPLDEPSLLAVSFEASSGRSFALSEINERTVLPHFDNLKFDPNRFIIQGNTAFMNYEYVDPRVTETLNLNHVSDFTLTKICGLDDDFELFHPEDVLHKIRLGLAVLLTVSVEGVVVHPLNDYYHITFRMGYEKTARFFTIHRRCFLSDEPDNNPGARHFDVWRAEPGHDDFEHVKAQLVINDRNLGRVLKALFFITNAQLLNLTPKDVFMCNFFSNYDSKRASEQINESLKAKIFSSSDFYSGPILSNIKSEIHKKLQSAIFMNTKGVHYQESVSKRSFSWKCHQLGLVPLPSLLEQTILENINFLKTP